MHRPLAISHPPKPMIFFTAPPFACLTSVSHTGERGDDFKQTQHCNVISEFSNHQLGMTGVPGLGLNPKS
jgi:hypothetical protein